MSHPKVYVAGHRGMVGSAIVRALESKKHQDIITRTRGELDLIDQSAVKAFFSKERPDVVYLAAAKVGGIHANNTYPATFIYENLMIEANIIQAAFESGVKKLLFLGSSCIYPKLASQPMTEDALLSGLLEPTNEPYAIAKIAGIKLCESYNRQYGVDYRSVMPTNLYGQNDNYHPENSHVIPALMRRFHEAKINNDASVTVWGSGKPKREFLFADDLAEACLHVMGLEPEAYKAATSSMQSHLNVGFGSDVTISDLASTMARVTGFKGEIIFDSTKPDGSPRKLMDSSRLEKLGWKASTPLEEGLAVTYQDFIKRIASTKE